MSSRYKRIKVIGKGSFGCCWLVQNEAGENWIMKQIDVSKMPAKQKEEASNEVRVLSKLKHPFIINYRESFVEDGLLCMITDYAERGDLYCVIHTQREKKNLFPESLVLRWFTQISLALKHVHDHRILHRDLKTQNIFLTGPGDGTVKMGDFGIARVLQHTQDCARTAIGTPYYLSPEICQEKPYSYKSDIWSLGCILYEIATLQHAFDAASMRGLVIKILKEVPPQVPLTFSSKLRSLVPMMLAKDPNTRPSINEVIQHPLVRGVIKQLLLEIEQRVDTTKADSTLKNGTSGCKRGNSRPSSPGQQAQQSVQKSVSNAANRVGVTGSSETCSRTSSPAHQAQQSVQKSVSNAANRVGVSGSSETCSRTSSPAHQVRRTPQHSASHVDQTGARAGAGRSAVCSQVSSPAQQEHRSVGIGGRVTNGGSVSSNAGRCSRTSSPRQQVPLRGLACSEGQPPQPPQTSHFDPVLRAPSVHHTEAESRSASRSNPKSKLAEERRLRREKSNAEGVAQQPHRMLDPSSSSCSRGAPPRAKESCPDPHDEQSQLMATLQEGLGFPGAGAPESREPEGGCPGVECHSHDPRAGFHNLPRFLLPNGEAVNLPVGARDSLAYRTEALKVYIESEIGLDNFLCMYGYLNDSALSKPGESVCCAEPLEKRVSAKAITFLPLIHQLIVCEDEFFNS